MAAEYNAEKPEDDREKDFNSNEKNNKITSKQEATDEEDPNQLQQ